MYRLQVLDSRCQELLTQFEGDQGKASGDGLTITSFSRRINSWGTLTFSLNQFSAKATPRNLCPYNRIQLYRLNKKGVYEPVWCGYIETVVTVAQGEFGTTIEIGAVGLEKMLRKRILKYYRATGCGADDAEQLLNLANECDRTCMTVGDMVKNEQTDLEFENTTMFNAFEDIARASNSEFTIRPDCSMDFVPKLGVNQSQAIQLSYNADGSYGGTVASLDMTQFGEDMINSVCATTSGFTCNVQNEESIEKYGKLEGYKTFSNARSEPTLCRMAENFVNQQAFPNVSRVMTPEAGRVTCPDGKCVGIQFGDINLGDLVVTRIKNGDTETTEIQRVIEIVVNIDSACYEDIGYAMSPTNATSTSSFLRRDEIEDIRQRLDNAGI